MTSINLVVIRATNMERLSHFYEQIGLHFIKHRHGKGPEHFSCEMGSIVFEIYPKLDETDQTINTRLGFKVQSIDAIIAELTKSGTQIISSTKDSPWGRRAVIVDPEGHHVELVEQL